MPLGNPDLSRRIDALDIDLRQRLPEGPRRVRQDKQYRLAIVRYDGNFIRPRLHDDEVLIGHLLMRLFQQQRFFRRQVRAHGFHHIGGIFTAQIEHRKRTWPSRRSNRPSRIRNARSSSLTSTLKNPKRGAISLLVFAPKIAILPTPKNHCSPGTPANVVRFEIRSRLRSACGTRTQCKRPDAEPMGRRPPFPRVPDGPVLEHPVVPIRVGRGTQPSEDEQARDPRLRFGPGAVSARGAKPMRALPSPRNPPAEAFG